MNLLKIGTAPAYPAANSILFEANWPGLTGRAGVLTIERLHLPEQPLLFLEHSYKLNAPNGVIVTTDRKTATLFESRDLGKTWTSLSLTKHCDRPFRRHFLTRQGWHIAQTAAPVETIVADANGKLIAKPDVGEFQWHGSWSIDDSPEGVVMFSQYRTTKEPIGGTLHVYRSTDGGRTWASALQIPGRSPAKAVGEIRHFHTCRMDPFIKGRWYVTAGDAAHECGLWITDDDGVTWRRMYPEVEGEGDIQAGELQRLMRFTAFTITKDHLIWATDDNVNSGKVSLVWLDKTKWVLSVKDHLGKNLIRSYIVLDDRYSVAVSESKQDNLTASVYLIEEHKRVVGSCDLRNLTQRKTGFTFSISSPHAVDGYFFSQLDGAVLSESKNGLLRWRVDTWPVEERPNKPTEAVDAPFAIIGDRTVNWLPREFQPAGGDLIAFFHAQRTGGMSVRSALIEAYGRDALMAFRIAPEYKHWSSLSEPDLARYRVYVGHAQFMERRGRRRNLYISIVRQPNERLVSLYRYIRGTPSHRLSELAREHDIEAFYRRAMDIDPDYVSNWQTRIISGSTDIDRALDLVASRYFAVGTSGFLDEFVVEMGKRLGWSPDIRLIHRNKAPTPRDFDVTPAFEAYAREINQADWKLYDFVQAAWRNRT